MADFPYTTVPGKIKPLLSKIRDVGVPAKVTVQWLKTVGFTSSNDASLVGILRYIGFTDASGVPTARWSQYRGADYKAVLGEALRQGYADLFAVYPDANQRTQGELDHVFSTSSSGGKQVLLGVGNRARTVGTRVSSQLESPKGAASRNRFDLTPRIGNPERDRAAAGSANRRRGRLGVAGPGPAREL